MAENKTRPDDTPPEAVIAAIAKPNRQAQARTLMAMMEEVTGEKPAVWGGRMIGFGRYDYTYASGHGGTWFLTGFAARKSDFSIHIMAGFDGMEDELARLGPHKRGVSCLYVTSLERIDTNVLRAMIDRSVRTMRERHSASAP